MAEKPCNLVKNGGGMRALPSEIGEIKAFMRTTAPDGYLACDGGSYSVALYPELTAMFTQEFGSAYYFGGSNGTFKVPDLRGEFLRGTGTNSHTDGGNGATVGTHQGATRLPHYYVSYNSSTGVNISARVSSDTASGSGNSFVNHDKSFAGTGNAKNGGTTSITQGTSGDGNYAYAVRPTNTSVLYCIRAY